MAAALFGALPLSVGFAQYGQMGPSPVLTDAESAPLIPLPDTATPPSETFDDHGEAPTPELTPDVQAVGAEEPAAHLPHDLSPWGMFLSADAVVKAVMIILVLASVMTWTVWLVKTAELVSARRSAKRAQVLLRSVVTFREGSPVLFRGSGPVFSFAEAATHELDASVGLTDDESIKERVRSRLERIEASAIRRMSRGTGILATIGSTAPFIGLFGTVWGIMNSFIGISEAQTTNLAVVAPGIAEALLATGLGLVAAIPAVIIYNAIVRAIGGYRMLLGDAVATVTQIISRDLDRRRMVAARAAE